MSDRFQSHPRASALSTFPALVLPALAFVLIGTAYAAGSTSQADEPAASTGAPTSLGASTAAPTQDPVKQDEAEKKKQEAEKKKQEEIKKQEEAKKREQEKREKEKEAEKKKEAEGHDGHDHDHDHGGTPVPSPVDQDLQKPGPRLHWEFGENSHDFGPVTQGAVVKHDFELESKGTEPLVIKQIKPTCGCTTGDLMVVQPDGMLVRYNFGDPIPVGSKLRLEARLNTKNKTGHASSSINVFSDDVRGPVQLSLSADVTPFFHVNPKFVNVGQMSVKEIKTEKVTIGTHEGQKLKFEVDVQKLPKGMFVDLLPLAPDENGRAAMWEAIVTLGPEIEEGNLAYPVLLRSDSPVPGAEPNADGTIPTQDVDFTVSARIMGVVSFNPQYLSMGLVRPGQVVPRNVKITSHDAAFTFKPDTKCRVVGVKGPDGEFQPWEYSDRFTAVVRPVDGESAIDIELRLDGFPEEVQGSFRGTLLVDIGHPSKPTVEIPITGVCRGGVVTENK